MPETADTDHPAVSAEDDEPSSVVPQFGEVNWPGVARWRRVLLALAAVVTLLWIAVDLHGAMDAAPADISAIQIVQLYTQSLYKLVVVIGLLLAGYVLSRAME